MSFLSTINTTEQKILTWFPFALQAVLTVEQSAKGLLPSASKAAVAINIAQAIATEAGAIPNPLVDAAAGLASMILSIVKGLNDSGFFTHSAKPAPVVLPIVAPVIAPVVPAAA